MYTLATHHIKTSEKLMAFLVFNIPWFGWKDHGMGETRVRESERKKGTPPGVNLYKNQGKKTLNLQSLFINVLVFFYVAVRLERNRLNVVNFRRLVY